MHRVFYQNDTGYYLVYLFFLRALRGFIYFGFLVCTIRGDPQVKRSFH